MSNKELTSVLLSGLAVTGGVLATVATGGTAPIAGLIFTGALAALGGIGGNLLSSYLENKFVNPTSKDEILKNGDLTRAVGKAIFILINDEAKKEEYGSFRKIIKIVGKSEGEQWEAYLAECLKEWEKYVKENIDTETLQTETKKTIYVTLEKLLPAQLTKFIKAREGEIDKLEALTPESWAIIVKGLFQPYQPSGDVCLKLGKRLHQNFPQALRKVLIDDFNQGGKAYASMTFRLLSEAGYYSKKNYEDSQEIKQKLDALIIRIDQVDALHQSNAITLDDKFWQDAFNLQKDIKDITSETLQRVIRIESTQQEHTEKLDKILKLLFELIENQAKQTKYKLSKPQGLINLPREKNDFFVEQSNIFSRLDLELTAHHLAYLHGTHGLGKTTTLVEYAFSREKDYDFIFYVLATDAAIEGEMARFADEFFEIIAAEDTPAQKASKVKTYLEENALWAKENKNWLIIFDNLESSTRISQYFPKTAKGDCLYACNEKLFIGNDREVDFEQFSQTEAELFVFQKINDASDAKHEDISAESLAEINKLVARLGKLPLALNIATAYLVETKVSIDEYIGFIKANVQDFLEQEDGHKASQHNTAFDAFLVTLDKISTFKGKDANGEIIGKLATNFLNLLIFCAPEDIPEELIKDTLFQTVDTSAATKSKNILFCETVALLKRYGLIREKENAFKYKEKFAEPKTLTDGTKAHWEEKETVISVIDTYRTLQDVLSVKLENEAKKSLLEQMLVVFNGLLPKCELTTWEIFEKYAVHAFPIAEQAEKMTISNKNSFRVCNQIGFYFKDIAKYREAEYFYLRGKTIAKDFYGKEHENTATSYNNLASLYDSQGRYEEAEPLFKQAIAISEKVFGENHPATATSYNNLASLYDSQGKYEEAEPLYKQALAISEKVLGENHPDTAGSYMNLGGFYYHSGKSQDGLKLCEKALKIFRNTLPAGHPSIQNCEGWVEIIKKIDELRIIN